MSTEDNHKQFKQWWSKAKNTLKCDEYDAFEIWQASANREGYKLVPIRCTNNMAHAAKEIDGRLSAFKYGDVWEAMIGACDAK